MNKDLIFLFFSEKKYCELEKHSVLKKYYSEITYIDYKNNSNRIIATVNCNSGAINIQKQSDIRNYSVNDTIVSFYNLEFLNYFDKNWDNIINRTDITILFFKNNNGPFHVKVAKINKDGQRPHYKIVCSCLNEKENIAFIKKLI